MRVQVIASGSGGNAYALHQEGAAPLLLEAGIPYKRLQVALRHQVSSLAGCLVSHEHGDHAMSVERLMRAGVDVYATGGTFDALGLTGHRAHPITALEPFDVGGRWIVTPVPAVHDAAEPVGFFVMAADGDRLLYLTDTAYCAHRFEQLSIVMVEANYSSELLRRQVTSGVVEAQVAARTIRNHMSLERCIDLLKANDLSAAREVYLLHLSNSNANEEQFAEAVRRTTGVPVYVAPERGVAA